MSGEIPTAWSPDRPRGASLEPPEPGLSGAPQQTFSKPMLAGLGTAGLLIAVVSCILGSVVGVPLRGEPAPDVTVKVTISPSPVYVTPDASTAATPGDGEGSESVPATP
ncbi:hypothetical protein ACFF2X_42600 [Cryptosporangium minutisporangium]